MATGGSSSAQLTKGKRMSTAVDAYKPLPDADAQDQQNVSQPCCHPTCCMAMQNQLDQVQKVLVQMQLNQPPLSSAHFHNIPIFTAELDRHGNGVRYQDWCEEYVAKCNAMGIVGDHLATDIVLHLRGKAYRVYNSLSKATLKSWEETHSDLKRNLDPDGTRDAINAFENLRMHDGETVGEFAAKLRKRCRQAYQSLSFEAADTMVLEDFKRLVQVPPEMKQTLYMEMGRSRKRSQTLTECLKVLEEHIATWQLFHSGFSSYSNYSIVSTP